MFPAPVNLALTDLDPHFLVPVGAFILILDILLSGLLAGGAFVGFDAVFSSLGWKKEG